MNIRHRVVAIIIKNNRILLVKGKGWPELWTPGGKIEDGENEEDTLKRELKEELGLELQTMQFFKKYFMENPYSKGDMTETKCFLVKVKGEPKPNQEIVRPLNRAEVKEKLLDSGVEVIGSSSHGLAAMMKSEMAKLCKVIRNSGTPASARNNSTFLCFSVRPG